MYSYIFYILTIMLATLFAGLAERYFRYNKNGEKVPHLFFWLLSMSVLILVMGLRSPSIGVDDLNYLRSYVYANSVGLGQYYQTYTTEPGFYILNRIIYVIFDDFQWLIIITSAFTVYCFYKIFANQIGNASLPLIVFMFATTQYFYYFGIIRLGLAVSIILLAYQFILNNNKTKYIIMVLLATMFHYSALFALILLFINIDYKKNIKSSSLLKLIVILPIALISIRLLVYPFITASRYQNYIETIGIINVGFITIIPFLILFLLHYNKFQHNKFYNFYFALFIIYVTTDMFSPIIGIGRMIWYVNISFIFLMAATIKVNKDYAMKFLFLILFIIYCIIYSYFAYFGDSHRGMFMIPYENILFEIKE
ncbi:EpsG family protein [Alkalicoccus daliensis]|uniref:EpsG family protein n=1 Tax=Alkalicoccus daliensis TaxID=745820 RepID=A0A1H0GFZ2_9BACI|nr:EpsG family protein [Alkalicoccus daliensis]SDO05827.1 EpsG family protein [Alkalicoccus daliensis]